MRPLHPFPARMAPEIALEALNELPANSLVLDPMAGSGTVLRAAIESGHRAEGFDTDPLAVLMARVWTTPIDVNALRAKTEETLGLAYSTHPDKVELPWIDKDSLTKEFIDYWFAPRQQSDLRRLVASLPSAQDPIGRAMQLGVSRTIVTKDSGASLARDVSHSRPHKVEDVNAFDVLAGFERAMRRLALILEEEPPPRGAEVHHGDARVLKDVADSTVSLVLTSPPYLNAIDYIRGHRLALVWLGHTVLPLRSIRSANVGAERAPDPGARPLQELRRELPAVAGLPSRLQRMVLRYREDLSAITAQVARVLRTQGSATFVIGNSTIRGVFVNNAELLIRAASEVGLRCVDERVRELPQTSRYLPLPQPGDGVLSRRIREEVVLRFVQQPS